MEAGKSLQLLIAAHELKQKQVDYTVITAVPYDITNGLCDEVYGEVSSRSGLPPHRSQLFDFKCEIGVLKDKSCSHILIDEAQFLTREHIAQLREFVESDGSHRVDCYGLKTDFKGEFFPGSLELMRCADELIEIPSMCSRCTNPATHNMRLDESGTAIKSGDQVALKETTTYVAVCYHCWQTSVTVSKTDDE